jgi:hypothetical protein
MKWIGCLLCAVGAWAQQEEPKIKVNLEGFRYPPIARSGRIQGDVIFEVGTTTLMTGGHPILVSAARANLETWASPPMDGSSYHVVYHFSLSGLKHERTCGPSYKSRTQFNVRRGQREISISVTASSCLLRTNVD